MNLQLLEEIHELQKQDISATDIANSLGMTKSNMMICLRMEKIISDKYEQELEEKNRLKAVNTSYLEQIDKLKNRLFKEEEKFKLLNSVTDKDLFDEISSLKKELDYEREYSCEFERFQNKYEKIPNFIKRWFE